MVDGGFLKPPTENAIKSEIWDETWKRVDRFLPDLYKEIFPEANPPTGKKTPPLNQELSSQSDEGKESPASVSN